MSKPSRRRSQSRTASRPQSVPTKKLPATQRGLPPQVARGVALAMIGIAVIGSYVLTPLPIAIGLTILAGVRLWIWQREVKREEAEAQSGTVGTVCHSTGGG